MKSVVVLLVASLFSVPAFAEDMSDFDIGKKKVVKHYQVTKCVAKDKCTVAEVTVFDKNVKDGEYYTQCSFLIKANKRFMMCDKTPSGPRVVEVVRYVPKVRVVTKTVTVKETKEVVKNFNRIQFMTGLAPVGVETQETEDRTIVTERKGLTFGVGYSRLLNEQVSVGLGIHTNKAFNLSLGFDF